MDNVYQITMTVISIALIIITIYNRIKYLCLKKASEMVAKAEERTDLTGEQKFSLVIIWIEEDLPKIFKNALFRTLLSKIINYVYNNSFEYMKNYVKRKTGQDISQIIDQVQSAINDSKDNIDKTLKDHNQ